MWPPFSGRAFWHQTIDLNYVKSKRQAPERVEVRTYSHCGGTRELDDDTASAVHVDARCPGSCLKAGREPGAPGTPRASARTGFGGHRSQAQAHTTLYVTDREQSNWQPETNLKSHRNSWFAAEHRS